MNHTTFNRQLKTFFSKYSVFLFFAIISVFYVLRLDYFPFYVFDEMYYADSAVQLYKGELDSNSSHPPLAKILISIPLYFFGVSPVAWRISSVAFGLFGLVLLYYFARLLKLSSVQALFVLVLLTASGGWYFMSRVAMLEVFVAFFILISVIFLYKYLQVNDFQRDYSQYSHTKFLYFAGFFMGVGGACKVNAFFLVPLTFLLFQFYFYGNLRKKMLHFCLYVLLSLSIFSLIMLGSLRFDIKKAWINFAKQVVYHNSAMLPENAVPANPTFDVPPGGVRAFVQLVVQDEVYTLRKNGYLPYSYFNNRLLLYSWFFLIIYFIFSIFRHIFNVARYKKAKVPVLLRDKDLLFLFFVSVFLSVIWIVFPRAQYIYYYVPAYPFIVLLISLILFRYSTVKWQLLYLVFYLCFFLFRLKELLPI